MANSSSEHNNTCLMDDDAMRIPLAFFYLVFFVFGLFGNLLALGVFLFVHGKKNSVHIFLINVAVADLLLVFCLPFRVAYHLRHNRWILGPVFCKVVGNVFYMNMYISIIFLGFISVDRYMKIQRNVTYRPSQESRWSSMACATVWAISISSVVPMIVINEGNEEDFKCFQYKLRQKAKGKGYFNFFMMAIFWLVFVLLIISYGKIAAKLLKISKKKPDLPNAVKFWRTAKKSFFVLFLFSLCFVPYHVIRIFYVYSQISDMPCLWRNVLDKANEAVLLLSTMNSCLDPVMYFLLSGTVRKATFKFVNRFISVQDSSNNSTSVEQRRTSVPHVSTTPRNSISLLITYRSK